MIYAQLDIDSKCVGVSELSGSVPEYNYQTPKTFDPITGNFTEGEPVFLSRMVEVPVYSEAYIGLTYQEDGTWIKEGDQ